MSGFFRSLWVRMMVSHLLVVAAAVAVLVFAGSRLGSTYLHDHLMGGMMSGLNDPGAHVLDDLERGVNAGFARALLWATLWGSLTAVTAAGIASVRVLRPLDEIRRVTRHLATGSYRERVPVPSERELAALANDVNVLAAALEQTEERRLRLISEVTHELRTPLATLKGYIEGLLDGVFQPDEETLSAAAAEAGRLERLTSDLATVSQVEDGRIDLRLEEIDLGNVAAEVAARLRPQFEDQQVTLVVNSGPPTPVRADRDRITQIFTNLIGNALTHTPPGGRVEVLPSIDGHQAGVAVTDSGRGLTAEQRDLVFERFYRADRSMAGGTGVGLTIARGLARLHGGDVTASSPGLGRGAVFELTMPVSPRS